MVEYKAPAPPEKTGKHRYVLVVMVPKNETTEALDLEVPSERKRWGYEGERSGVREFAGVNGLKVIGKYFFFFFFFFLCLCALWSFYCDFVLRRVVCF